MDDDGLLTKAELAELLAGRRPDAPVTPAGTVPDWLNKAFDREEERMRESKKRKVVEVEAPPAKRRRAAHGAAAGLNKITRWRGAEVVGGQGGAERRRGPGGSSPSKRRLAEAAGPS